MLLQGALLENLPLLNSQETRGEEKKKNFPLGFIISVSSHPDFCTLNCLANSEMAWAASRMGRPFPKVGRYLESFEKTVELSRRALPDLNMQM